MKHGSSDHEQPEIAVVVLTHNRCQLLEQCVDRVLGRTSDRTREIVVWDNASDDGTAAFLGSLANPRLRVVNHDKNIGQNAYDLAIQLTTAPYIIEVDDDVVDAPVHWDEVLLDAFLALPRVGFLSANLVDDSRDATARIMYGTNAHLYRIVERHGVRLKVDGPVGGGCSMTSRELHDAVGGFGRQRKLTFWYEDAVFIKKLGRLGYEAAYLNDLCVHHTGGPEYSPILPEKREFWQARARRARRRNRVKRMLLRAPLVRPLNARYRWFEPPPTTP